MDFALRVAESTAFSLHALIGLTEPCHGALEFTLQVKGSLPRWFWPLAGLLLGVASYANFSGSEEAVLCAQAYVAAFHTGAMFWHWRLQHHPASVLAPLLFVGLAAVVFWLRLGSFLLAFLGTAASAGIG
ncbi:unnamed protein product, partial [Symbiodinium necroappetens]